MVEDQARATSGPKKMSCATGAGYDGGGNGGDGWNKWWPLRPTGGEQKNITQRNAMRQRRADSRKGGMTVKYDVRWKSPKLDE